MTLTPKEREQLRRDQIRRERLGREALYQAGIAQLQQARPDDPTTPIMIDLPLRSAA